MCPFLWTFFPVGILTMCLDYINWILYGSLHSDSAKYYCSGDRHNSAAA